MNVRVIKGKHTDNNIQACYHYLVKIYRREIAKRNESYLRKSIDGRIGTERIFNRSSDRRSEEEGENGRCNDIHR